MADKIDKTLSLFNTTTLTQFYCFKNYLKAPSAKEFCDKCCCLLVVIEAKQRIKCSCLKSRMCTERKKNTMLHCITSEGKRCHFLMWIEIFELTGLTSRTFK